MTSLSLRRNPLGLLVSGGLWASVWYLAGYLVVGWLLFGVALIIIVAGCTVFGIPLLIAGGTLVIRWCADAERARLRTVDPRAAGRPYRESTGSGLLARVRADWWDPAIWRDVAYLFGLLAPLWLLDFAVLAVWLTFLAGIASPAWEAVTHTCIGYCPAGNAKGIELGYFPHGPHGPGTYGFYVGTLPGALVLAVICLVAFLLFSYVVVATARLHASIARGLLLPPEDVLRRPGPN
jgi:hypothetical protein